MDSSVPLVLPLAAAASIGDQWVGGKAAKLSELLAFGYRVPAGFCITTRAYQRFLEAEGRRLAQESIEDLSDTELSAALDDRAAIFSRWKQTYWDEFIPFAHGVRQLGTYYNDAIKPADPYEFLNVLRHQPMIAADRNAVLRDLAGYLEKHPELGDVLRAVHTDGHAQSAEEWSSFKETVARVDGGPTFVRELERASERFMDVAYAGEQLDKRLDLVLHTVVEMVGIKPASMAGSSPTETLPPEAYEKRLLAAVGPDRHEEARSVLEIARLSWRLRDDDNVLLGRVEKQLLRAAGVAAERLERSGRIKPDARITVESAPVLSAALLVDRGGPVVLPEPKAPVRQPPFRNEGETPRLSSNAVAGC